jgi:hypothetical protein
LFYFSFLILTFYIFCFERILRFLQTLFRVMSKKLQFCFIFVRLLFLFLILPMSNYHPFLTIGQMVTLQFSHPKHQNIYIPRYVHRNLKFYFIVCFIFHFISNSGVYYICIFFLLFCDLFEQFSKLSCQKN